MIETALIDGDICAYRCAAATENDTEDIALYQTSEMMRRILHETDAMAYKCFLGGSSNFRYSIYPDYKANRKDMVKPRWLQAVREHLVVVWNATIADGIEADDCLGIEQIAANATGEYNTVIASIDKDLLMVPGHHYNFVKQEARFVTPLEGKRQLYFQLIMGDRSDNVPGFDSKMRLKVPKFLEPQVAFLEECTTELEMYEHVLGMYNDDKDTMHRNAKVLYIWHKPEDEWLPPTN